MTERKYSDDPTENQILKIFASEYCFQILRTLMKKPMTVAELAKQKSKPVTHNELQARVAIAREEGLDHDACLNNPKGKNPGDFFFESSDVFFINPTPLPEAHFATFPVALPLKILKCACPPKGIVLDPFFGAGTVGIAAEKLGLNWCGIELKKEYTEIARNRLNKYRNIRLDDF